MTQAVIPLQNSTALSSIDQSRTSTLAQDVVSRISMPMFYSLFDYIYDKLINSKPKFGYNQTAPSSGPVYVDIDFPPNMTQNMGSLFPIVRGMIVSSIENEMKLITPGQSKMFNIIYLLFVILGILSNLLMIYVFYKSEKLRTLRNVFIINLAISDILLCLVYAPLTLTKSVNINWSLGRTMCKLQASLPIANVMVSS